MRSIREYIFEGFYKNVSADPRTSIIKWINDVNPYTKRGYISPRHNVTENDIQVDPDGGIYIDCKEENFLIDIHPDNRDAVFGPELDLIRVKGDVCITINKCDGISKRDIERLSRISDHISDVDINNCKKNIPLESFPDLSSGASDTTHFSIHGLQPISLKGCPNCQTLDVAGEVNSLAGTRITDLESMDIGYSQVKSLKGAPPVGNGAWVSLCKDVDLNDGGFKDLLSRGCKIIDTLNMSTDVIDRVKDGDVWGNVKVKTLNLNAGREWNPPDNFPDIIPDCNKITIMSAVYGRSVDFRDRIKKQLEKFGKQLDGIRIEVR